VLRHSSSSSSSSHGDLSRQQHELCKALGWLFGPQAVLLLGCQQQQQQHNNNNSRLPAAPHVSPALAWAQHPFQAQLVAALQQQMRHPGKQQQPGAVLTWLVEQLGAPRDPARNVLCLAQLSLLSKQTLAAVSAARSARRTARRSRPAAAAAAGRAAGVEGGQAQDLDAAVAHVQQQLQQDTHDVTQEPQQQQQQQQHVDIQLEGQPLLQPDAQLSSLQAALASELRSLQSRLRKPPEHLSSPKHLPKAAKKAVQESLRLAVHRLQQLQQQQQQVEQQGTSSSSSSCVQYGLMAVLDQHGFVPLLAQWGFIRDGELWQQLLLQLPQQQHSSQAAKDEASARQAAAVDTATLSKPDTQLAAAAASGKGLAFALNGLVSPSTAVAAAAMAAAAAAVDNKSRPSNVLLQILGKKDPAAGLKLIYRTLSSANKCTLQAAGGRKVHPAAADALKAESLQLDDWTWFSVEDVSTQPQQSSSASSNISSGCCCVVNLPPLCMLQQDGSMRQLLVSCKRSVVLDTPVQLMQQMPETAARAAAREALDWLVQQNPVVEAVAAAIIITRPQQQQQQGQQQQHMTPSAAQDVRHVDVRVVKAPSKGAASAAATATAAVMDTAAHTAAAGAAAALKCPLSPQRTEQQQQQPGHAPAAEGHLASKLSSVSLQPAGLGQDAASPALALEAEQQQGAAAAAAEAAAAAAKQYRNRLRSLQDQMKAMQRKLQQRTNTLQEQEELLVELEAEEAAALQAAGLGSTAAASSSCSVHNNNAVAGADAPDAGGDALLEMALQQSTESVLKGLRHELNDCKCRVRQSKESLRQLGFNLQKLEAEQAALQAGGPGAFAAKVQMRRQPVQQGAACEGSTGTADKQAKPSRRTRRGPGGRKHVAEMP
jgi:hypothetical protein